MTKELQIVGERTLHVQERETIYDALKRNGVYLAAPCGGKGSCGKCKVRVLQGQFEAKGYGRLQKTEIDAGMVLACQSTPSTALVIEIPKESKLVLGGRIAIAAFKDPAAYLTSYGVTTDPLVKRLALQLPPPSIQDNISDLERVKRAVSETSLTMSYSYELVSTLHDVLREGNWNVSLSYSKLNDVSAEALSLFLPDRCKRRFGLAIDIGTTTVVVYLVDFETGQVLDIGSTYNSQTRYGDDVITRIVYATEPGATWSDKEANGLEDLRDAVVGDINTIVSSFMDKHAISGCEIDGAVIAANTTMSQIFWGLNPASIREDPYIPTVNIYPVWKAQAARLSINPQSPVYTSPAVASYVGGDVVAGILASKLYKNPELSLFMDIGTNAEVAIGNNEWIMTAACSAGPCFEGSGIRHGMRATPGAIDSVKIDPVTLELGFGVIDGVAPVGICGSGMIDAIVEMYTTGIINQKGIFVPDKSQRIRQGQEGLEFVFHHDPVLKRDIVLTQVDIENLIRAKAAIFAGVSLLLNEVGMPLEALDRVYIAGGFGNSLNVPKAIMLGMLPDLERDKYVFLGNTSIIGAYLALMSDELRRELEDIASKMTYVELSVVGGYMDEYISAMFIPHTDMTRFPSAVT
ncbi:MAG: ASKHA domain-containing protein [Candidatus Magnetobacterium sp. LHC-1]